MGSVTMALVFACLVILVKTVVLGNVLNYVMEVVFVIKVNATAIQVIEVWLVRSKFVQTTAITMVTVIQSTSVACVQLDSVEKIAVSTTMREFVSTCVETMEPV